MILLIDNYDSFTYNLFQYISEKNSVVVVRNDKITIPEIEQLDPEAIIISPGPGLPDSAGICSKVVQQFYQTKPILGVCLGHQVIAVALGGKVKPANQIIHGKTSFVAHNKSELFKNMQSPEEVMRYHSYVIDPAALPSDIIVTGISVDDNEIMAIEHKEYPVYGLQFHPESIGSPSGKQIIENFLNLIGKELVTNETIS